MGFVKSRQELAESRSGNGEFYDAEMLMAFFVTKQEVSARLLPPPLRPPTVPLGCIFLANYPRTNFGVTYLESALLLATEFEGEQGLYCLSMPVTNDMALILGRETFGYPKKMANIHFTRDDTEVEGWVERHGVRLLDVRARLAGSFGDEDSSGMVKAWLESNVDAVIFNYKYFRAPTRKGFDYDPRLVREVVRFSRRSIEFAQAEIVLGSSHHDPWADVEVVKVLGATYTVGNNTMLPGTVVAEVGPDEFAPYASMKLDALS
jgi:acetoacetate decarboxylase